MGGSTEHGLTANDFEKFVRESAGQIRAVIRRIVRQDAEIDDALQETYLAAWKGRSSFDGRSSMKTWIHRIAVNTALNRMRQNKSLRILLETDQSAFTPDETRTEKTASGPEMTDAVALREIVWAAVDELPEDARLVLVMRDVEGFSSEEVAASLGISDASVRQRLHRARRAVAERLKPELCDVGEMTCGGQLDLLLDYLDSSLPADLLVPVTDHVRDCPTCHAMADIYARTISLPLSTAFLDQPAPEAVVNRIVIQCRDETPFQ